jgi:hypothetical protein
VFWSLSFAEWRALVAPRGEALSRAGLQSLMNQFPD